MNNTCSAINSVIKASDKWLDVHYKMSQLLLYYYNYRSHEYAESYDIKIKSLGMFECIEDRIKKEYPALFDKYKYFITALEECEDTETIGYVANIINNYDRFRSFEKLGINKIADEYKADCIKSHFSLQVKNKAIYNSYMKLEGFIWETFNN